MSSWRKSASIIPHIMYTMKRMNLDMYFHLVIKRQDIKTYMHTNTDMIAVAIW